MNVPLTDRLDTVPFRVTDPELVPVQRYHDPEFYRLENERLWPHVWQMACRLEEIPEVGDAVEYTILGKSVILVRTKSGVKAFHNVCRHRGVKLVEGPENCEVKGFVCPFHGWRWNIDGENTFVYSRQLFSEEKLAKAEIDLKPCRVEFWAGCAFINFDNSAPSLLECLGPVADRMNIRNVDKLKMDWWYQTILPTNWKLAMEAFMEGYHVMRTHPQLHELLVYQRYGQDVGETLRKRDSRAAIALFVDFLHRLSSGMAGQVSPRETKIAESLRDMELPEDVGQAMAAFSKRFKDEIYHQGLAEGLAVPDLNTIDAADPHRGVEFMFPHYFLLPMYSAMASYRIRPLGPESCLFEIWALDFRADDDPRERVKVPTFLAYDSKDYPEVPQQDYSNLPRQQLGLHGGEFEFMRLSKDVEGLISNYHRLIDGYLAGLDPDQLASSTRIVNCGYESPILDIKL